MHAGVTGCPIDTGNEEGLIRLGNSFKHFRADPYIIFIILLVPPGIWALYFSWKMLRAMSMNDLKSAKKRLNSIKCFSFFCTFCLAVLLISFGSGFKSSDQIVGGDFSTCFCCLYNNNNW